MVAKRKGKSAPAAKRRDPWALPTLLLFLAVVLYIGHDCYAYHQRLVGKVAAANASVKSAEAGVSQAARTPVLEAQLDLLRQGTSAAAAAMERIRGSASFGMKRQLATLYRNLGHYHYSRQESLPCLQAYSLALCYDPSLEAVAPTLAQEAFLAKEWELGLHAAELALEAEDSKPMRSLRRMCRKRLGE